MLAAAELGNEQKIYFIFECNATEINSIDSDGKTALYLAAENNNYEVVRLLLTHQELDVNKGIESGNRAGASALYISALRSHTTIFQFHFVASHQYLRSKHLHSTLH